MELIPYFLGLLALLGSALAAVLLSPLTALLRLFRRRRGAAPAEPTNQARTAPVPESPGEGKDRT
jgi:hypothetical protein